jgi:mono/diheme cytochrome c family protein
MKIKILMLAIILGVMACGGGGQNSGGDNFKPTPVTGADAQKPTPSSDERGVGPIKEVKLTNPLDAAMVSAGEGVYKVKCGSCHRLNEEKLVGPGWKGVTSRRKPEWIMNFSVNVDEMLNKDAKAMAMLEECLVRMPNQNLTEKDARSVLEFMRKNDGEK